MSASVTCTVSRGDTTSSSDWPSASTGSAGSKPPSPISAPSSGWSPSAAACEPSPGSRSRYIKNLLNEKKLSTASSATTSHRFTSRSVSRTDAK